MLMTHYFYVNGSSQNAHIESGYYYYYYLLLLFYLFIYSLLASPCFTEVYCKFTA